MTPSQKALLYTQKENLNGNYNNSYEHSLAIPPSLRSGIEVINLINEALSNINLLEYREAYEEDVLNMMNSPQIASALAQQRAEELLHHKFKALQSSKRLTLVDFSNDPLFKSYLEADFCRSFTLEPLFIELRKKLFTQSLIEMELPESITSLCKSLAIQNWHNEYIHPITSEERNLLSQLETLLNEQCLQPNFHPGQVEGLLLLTSMYQPLSSTSHSDLLLNYPTNTWPASLQEIVELTLYTQERELEFSKNIPSIGSINNGVSKKVRSQYEENPYPRWNKCINSGKKQTYFKTMRDVWPEDFTKIKELQRNINSKTKILIAGCGTGKHPIQRALNIDSDITAIDITRRSLGYAAMMAEHYQARNINFVHMDLLECEKLGTMFDIIESVGVLHHMENPEKGLQSLLNVIKPGGIIRLGLYSKTARNSIRQLRSLFLKTKMEASLNNIREVRKAILSSDALDEIKGAALFGDFYSTSSCRDLLFHKQEKCYDIIELKELLERNQLNFLGFTFGKTEKLELFIKKYGKESICDLEKWHEYEQENPSLFSSMYQFYCATPSPNTRSC